MLKKEMKKKENKIEKIITYIIAYFQNNYKISDLGLIKLNKILWFADKIFMYKHYKSITEQEYIRNPYGPVVKKMEKILKKLETQGYIKTHKISRAGMIQTCFLCLKEPDLKNISAEEISIIDSVITELAFKSAKELSQETHDELWECTKNGDILPLESVFFKDIIEPSEEDIQWALKALENKKENSNANSNS